MSILDNIEPKNVLYWFEELSKIPRGSGNTKPPCDFCEAVAKKYNLEFIRDSADNCIIKKPASKGYENSDPVIIQGHLDMVCEKSEECDIDFEKDAIRLKTDGEYIYADGTTLGGDDGIAVAMALAILTDEDAVHPPLEVVFTSDEEIGMLGAEKLDCSGLKGRRLINIDSEEEGIFTVSCAGGNVSECVLPVQKESFGGECYEINVGGLAGGHSGVEIDKGRHNANILLARVLDAVSEVCEMRIVSVEGGLKDNAIPVSSKAIISIISGNPENAVSDCENMFKNEAVKEDSELYVKIKRAENGVPFSKDSTEKIICMLMCLPNGIQEMSTDIQGLVKTSLNLGILKSDSNCVTASYCVRSSMSSEKEALKRKLYLLMKSLGGSVYHTGDYPAWEYQRNSPLRDVMCKVFEEEYGRKPECVAIHAGLECGMFCGKIEGLECVSVGPDIKDIHTPKERLDIKSVQRTWEFLVKVLAEMKKQ